MAGTINGELYQALFLSFYMARLVQFLFKSYKGVEMFQSNMICIIFAYLALTNCFGASTLATAQCIVMMADAYIGSMLFIIQKNIHLNMLNFKLGNVSKIARRIRLTDMNDETELDENYQKLWWINLR